MLTQPGGGRTAIVAEDHEDARETLAQMLELLGFRVLRAGDGNQALAHLRRGPHADMIFLDMMMPGMNGWEVLYEIQGDSKLAHIPVVVISAAADMEGMEEEGPVVFLQKPVDPQTLIQVLEHYCCPTPS